MNDNSPARTLSRETNLQFVGRLSMSMDMAGWPAVKADAGQRLFSTGDPVLRLPLIERGTIDAVEHQLADDGNPVVIVSWGEGELVMLSQLFAHEPSMIDLVASESVRLRWLPIVEIEKALLVDQDLLVLLVRFLAMRLREVQERERGWLARDVHGRVCRALVRIVRAMPSPDDKRVEIAATHEVLATRCGVSRPRLSRELKRLEEDGLLRLGRGTIEILDRDAFLAAAPNRRAE